MATLTTEKGELKTKEDKKLIGSETKERLLTAIEGGIQSVYERAQEDDPTSLSDEAARLGVGTAELVGNVAGAPVIKQTLSVLDFPFWVARQSAGGVLEHGFGVDPFYGQAAVGVGEVFLGGKGLVSGATKSAKLAKKGAFATKYAVQETVDAARAARLARKGKLWQRPGADNIPIDRSDVFKADDLSYGRGPQKKTYTQTHPRTVYPDPKSIPDDPWGSPTDKLKDIARRHDMKMSLFKSIGVDDFEPFVPDFDEFLAIKKGLPIVADANVTASHAKKLKKLKLGNLGSVFHREELTRVSKKTGLGQLTRREAQTISNESVKNFTKSAPERVGMIDELRSFYSNLTERQIIPELDHKNPLKLSAYLMDGQDLAGRRNIRKIIFDESGLYTGDDIRNFEALPREVHAIWTRNMNRIMGVELEKFIAEMVKKGITDRTKIAKIYARRIREQRNKFDKAYEAHKITHGVRKNPVTGKDIIRSPQDIETVLSALADINVEDWAPARIRDFARQALGDYNIRDPYRTKDLVKEGLRKQMQDTYERILALNQELDNPKLKLSDTQITGKIKLLEKLNKKFKKLEDKLF